MKRNNGDQGTANSSPKISHAISGGPNQRPPPQWKVGGAVGGFFSTPEWIPVPELSPRDEDRLEEDLGSQQPVACPSEQPVVQPSEPSGSSTLLAAPSVVAAAPRAAPPPPCCPPAKAHPTTADGGQSRIDMHALHVEGQSEMQPKIDELAEALHREQQAHAATKAAHEDTLQAQRLARLAPSRRLQLDLDAYADRVEALEAELDSAVQRAEAAEEGVQQANAKAEAADARAVQVAHEAELAASSTANAASLGGSTRPTTQALVTSAHCWRSGGCVGQ